MVALTIKIMFSHFMNFLLELENQLHERKGVDSKKSYSSQLYTQGLDAILLKLHEEVGEVMLASRDFEADSNRRPELIHEAADLMFHFLLLLSHQEINFEEVMDELRERQHRSGLEEKAARHNNTA